MNSNFRSKLSLLADRVYEAYKYTLYCINGRVYIDINNDLKCYENIVIINSTNYDVFILVNKSSKRILIDNYGNAHEYNSLKALNKKLKQIVSNIITNDDLYKHYKSKLHTSNQQQKYNYGDLIVLKYDSYKVIELKLNISSGCIIVLDEHCNKILNEID